MMGEIFTSPARPFYQSTAIMELHPIDIGTYTKFIRKHFLIANKDITEETVQNVYERFEGITWHIQFISNSLYAMTATGEICTADKVSIAIRKHLVSVEFYLFLSSLSTSSQTKGGIVCHLQRRKSKGNNFFQILENL